MAFAEDERQLSRSPSCGSLFGGGPGGFVDPEEETSVDAPPLPPPWLEDHPTCGLAWAKRGLSLCPEWEVEPTVESVVATLEVAIGCNQQYDVRFLHEGTLSKLYDVSFGNQAFVMRVSLPVHPRAKTEAEVATLDWVYQHTRLPVPRVRAHDSSRNNPLGFEWILMTKLEGKPLSECWSSVTMGSKERLVKQIAGFSRSTFRQPFRGGIGSLYKTISNVDGCSYVGKRARDGHRRLGSFTEASSWMKSRLRCALYDLESRLGGVTHDNERGTLQRMLDLTGRIDRLMPEFYPSATDPETSCSTAREAALGNAEETSVRTMLHHDCLSLDNILINDDGIFTGVVDWQCISCLPFHVSCQFPTFLQQANDRFAEPIRNDYLVDQDGSLHAAYYRDRKRYELTRLRQMYIEEMMNTAPGFVDVWRCETSASLRDYEAAVQNCDNEFTIEWVKEWVEAVERGGDPAPVPKRLHDLLAA
ncbi:phosphotransferase enzyme family-domain-containing protein [Xylaria sp. FL0933]|nr:phosphotransferase enzyme family-domain-containing protein [Xylaria sp. FL0933]